MSKPCHIFSENKNETYVFTNSKPNIMKNFKYQQYFYCFIVCILVPYAFILLVEYSSYSNKPCI